MHLAAHRTRHGQRPGCRLAVWTDEPGVVQFYTSNFLNGTLVGIRRGPIYRRSGTVRDAALPEIPTNSRASIDRLETGGQYLHKPRPCSPFGS